MSTQHFDDVWFSCYRGHLLGTFAPPEGRRAHMLHSLLSGTNAPSELERETEAAIRRLPPRHMHSVCAHRQFYRACLLATGLLPADPLVNVAVQVEWFWYNTAALGGYRDHLAHAMKVAALALSLLQDRDGPLAKSGEPLIDRVAEELARGSMGSPALRAAARRCGNPEEQLRRDAFWRSVVLETVRVAGLLHDMAHPAVTANKLERIAAPVRLRTPFEPREEEMCRQAMRSVGHRLLASPFHGGELPGPGGLSEDELRFATAVFARSHGMRAGYALSRMADQANQVWQMCPMDSFIMEWAALAVALHDPFDLQGVDAHSPGHAGATEQQSRDVTRIHFRSDPVSYMLALADFMQEFGRISSDSEGRKGDDVDYPCRAVCLDTYQGEATLTFELGPEGERPFGATPRQVAATTAQKKRLGQVLFGQGTEDGLLVHTGLMSALNVEVKQARAERRSEVAKQKAGPRPLRMFISYAHQDESVRVELDKHLKPLAQDGLIESWSYRQIEPGSDWRKEVQRHLGEADLVVPLLSVDFINSDFAFGVELRSALDQRQRMRVIPILVRPFAMNDELKDIQMLPTDNGVLRPLSEWGDRRESGLTEVACGIKRVIEKMRRADGG